MTRLLGLDVGTSSVKGIAIDGDGAVLAVAERGHPLSTPRPGWSEQDPEDWWRGAAEVLDELDASTAAASGSRGRCTGSWRSTRPRARCARQSCGTTGARRRSATRSSGASGSSAWSP
jgi:hypothetical protein